MIRNFKRCPGLCVLTVCGVVLVTVYVIIGNRPSVRCTSRDGCGKEQDSLSQHSLQQSRNSVLNAAKSKESEQKRTSNDNYQDEEDEYQSHYDNKVKIPSDKELAAIADKQLKEYYVELETESSDEIVHQKQKTRKAVAKYGIAKETSHARTRDHVTPVSDLLARMLDKDYKYDIPEDEYNLVEDEDQYKDQNNSQKDQNNIHQSSYYKDQYKDQHNQLDDQRNIQDQTNIHKSQNNIHNNIQDDLDSRNNIESNQNNLHKDPSGIQTDHYNMPESPHNLQNKPGQATSQSFPDPERHFVRECVSGDTIGEVADTLELVPLDPLDPRATEESPRERQKSFQHVFDARAWGHGWDQNNKGLNASGNKSNEKQWKMLICTR